MLTVDVLKDVYVALGGSADDVADLTLIPEVIAKIAVQAAIVTAAANAKELPAVTSSNNGQVLTVDGGKWKAKALPE